MRILVPLVLEGFFFSSVVCAGQYYDGRTGQLVKESVVVSQIGSGQVLIVSELHDNEAHHQNQRDIIVRISRAKFPISVGMEFFDYTDQKHVTAFGYDKIDEPTFLKLINWGKNSFDFYRFQVRIPYYLNGETYALNFPRELSGKVAKGGLASLSPDERSLMPPNFSLGSATYRERFSDAMKGHASEEQIENYFAAQSLWDDTMAWRAQEAMAVKPTQLLMIIVGDFHVAYQDGLIARLRARGVQNILSISQVDTSAMSDEEKSSVLNPDVRYGVRADFIFDAASATK